MKDYKNFIYNDKEYIKYKRSNRAKRLIIRIKEFEGVEVTIPCKMPLQTAKKMVAGKKNWIITNLKKTQRIENQYTFFDKNSTFHTKQHKLKLISCNCLNGEMYCNISNGLINIYYNAEKEYSKDCFSGYVRQCINKALRIEAKLYLPYRTMQLSNKYNIEYNKLFIRNQKTRWGSCSSKKNINLNLQLMRLPYHLIDYVIIHELVHIKHHNHGKDFWKALTTIIPDAISLHADLKKYRPQIY
jgi:hypothetical protein